MESLEETSRHRHSPKNMRLIVRLYALAAGELLETLVPDVPLLGCLLVATEGAVTYLHALGKYGQHSVDEVHSWQLVEGRTRPIATGPIQLEEPLAFPNRQVLRFGFEATYSLDRLFLPTKNGLATYEPYLSTPPPRNEREDPTSTKTDDSRLPSYALSQQDTLRESATTSVEQAPSATASLIALASLSISALAVAPTVWRRVKATASWTA